MATSEVLLLHPVEGLGGEGDAVTVRAGYSRNYLLPLKKAILISHSNRKQIAVLQNRRQAREAQELERAQSLAKRIEALSIAIPVKTGEGGKMFGAVTATDLLARFLEEGIEIDKKRVSLYSPIKALGQHSTRIRLHKDIVVDFTFEVVSETPIESAQ